MFFVTLNNLISLFICIVVGVICRKRGITNDTVISGLSKMLTSITLPALIISSMQKPFEIELVKDSGIILIVMMLIHLLGAGIGILFVKIFKVSTEKRGPWIFTCSFSNVTFMGFPVIAAMFGSEALFLATFCSAAFSFLVYTLGVKLIQIGFVSENPKNKNNIFLNAPIVSTAIGFTLFLSSIKIPDVILTPISNIGNMTTPLSMIIIGSILAKGDIKTVFSDITIYTASLVRLVLLPVIVFLIVRTFISNTTVLGIIVISTAMPAATLTAILAETYESNYIYASKVVFVSTLLSIITIPLISLLIR